MDRSLQTNPKKNSYLLIDFRMASKKPQKLRKNVWFILYERDYSGAQVLRKGHEALNIKFDQIG